MHWLLQADAYYKYDQAELQALQQQRPWSKDPAYFKKCERPQEQPSRHDVRLNSSCQAATASAVRL
jgi:hypothetical protein